MNAAFGFQRPESTTGIWGRRWLVHCSVAVVLLGIADSRAADRPHIIIMLADDLGWGDVGYHGSRIKTPNIDELASKGVRLEQFYAQPVCSPTRGALMTGRYPLRLGLQCGVVRPWATHGLPLDERTLPSALKEVGYRTAIVGKWHLGHAYPRQLPLQRGFDLQYGHYNGALDYFTHIRDGGHDWHRNDQPSYDQGYSTDLLATEATRIIAEHDTNVPLFLYVPFNAPHTPLQVPEQWQQPYSDLSPKARQTYAGMVACMDAAVGQIAAAAAKHLPAEQTIVFFCSDNGGIPRLGSNGPLRSGKGTLYEGGVRVPAIMQWAGRLPQAAAINEPMHIVDVYPTMLRLAGADLGQSKPLDGEDIWEVLADGASSPHQEFVFNLTPFHGAIRQGDWKLVHNGQVTANATSPPAAEKWELFNLRDDRSESHDLSQQEPRILKQLQARLSELEGQAVEPQIPPNQPPHGFVSPAIWGNFPK